LRLLAAAYPVIAAPGLVDTMAVADLKACDLSHHTMRHHRRPNSAAVDLALDAFALPAHLRVRLEALRGPRRLI
jgi:hypothetical protein